MEDIATKISIIVPVYKSEEYLSKCIDSILGQTLIDFELLLIDDGSPDQSGVICEEYAIKDRRIKVIHKENGGVSSARNTGLKIANGKYIWFIDSDDWIEENCLHYLTALMDIDQLDALQIGYYTVTNNEIIPCHKKFRKTTEVLSSAEYVLPDMFIGGVCGTLVRNELVRKYNISFDEHLQLAEDQLFFLTLFNYAQRVKRQDILAYYYRNNPTSATRSANEAQLNQSIIKIKSFRHFQIFEVYCRYLIAVQFFEYLYLSKKNIFNLHRLVKPYILFWRTEHKYFENRNKSILRYYSYFGLWFIIPFSILRTVKKWF